MQVAFWSSQTLEKRLKSLVEPSDKDMVDCNAITLSVGREIFVTPHIDEVFSNTKRILCDDEAFQIPPEQFAFILTEERVSVPADAMAFISMKATFKMQGLINVSGFHIDPGWEGPLIFAVFNAGPSPVHLQRKLPLFLVWYASLDEPSEKQKTKPGADGIPPNIIGNLSAATDTLYALDKRLKNEVKKRDAEDKKLSDRIHEIRRGQTALRVTLAVLLTLATGITLFVLRSDLSELIAAHTSSATEVQTDVTHDGDVG
jgi:dCTP deaminase